MANGNDKVVSKVYETYDYDKFKVLAENRGHAETKGIKAKKLKTLQGLIDSGLWIHSLSRVRVNLNFEIIDGAHTFVVSKANGLPINYEITEEGKFNEVPKRQKIGNIYSINSVTTSWSSRELFSAACQVKGPLALLMQEIIEANDNYFLWTDLLALLEKDTNYFLGRWRKANMSTFERRELIDAIQTEEFKWELNFFVKLNLKARIAIKKGILLRAAYDILWHARTMVEPKLMRKALVSLPETSVASNRALTDDSCRRMLIQHYNKSQGQQVEVATVLYALKHKDAQEPELILGL